MSHLGKIWLAVFIMAVLSLAGGWYATGAEVEYAPDGHTLFLAHFNNTLDADYAKGTKTFRGKGILTEEGRFGKGLVVLKSAEFYNRISYRADDGNINQAYDRPSEGTVEFWLKPNWDGTAQENHWFFYCSGPESNYLSIGADKNGLSVSIMGGPGAYRRISADISGWRKNEWHHVAVTWGNNQARLWLDGRESASAKDVIAPAGLKTFSLHAEADGVFDELRISDNQRTFESAAPADKPTASGPDGHEAYAYLSDLKPVSVKQAYDRLGNDGRRDEKGRINYRVSLRDNEYEKGLWTHAYSEVRYALDGNYEQFRATIGIDDRAGEEGGVIFRVYGDGRKLYDSAFFPKAKEPEPIRVPVKDVKELALIALEGPNGAASDHAVWADAVVVKKDQQPPVSTARRVAPVKTEPIASLDGYDFALPASPKGYHVYETDYLDPLVNPARPDENGNLANRSLTGAAAPGEYEPLCFSIYAATDLKGIEIKTTGLTGGTNVIPGSNIEIRVVKRIPEIRRRDWPNKPENRTIWGKLLEKNTPFDLPGGNFKKIWLTVKIPTDAAGGTYRGTVEITPRNAPPSRINVAFEVLPVALKTPPDKKYGLYYFMRMYGRRTELELKNMREYGLTTVCPWGVRMDYVQDGDRITPDCTLVEKALELLRNLGFEGPIPIDVNFMYLAKLLGHTDVGETGQTGASLDNDPRFTAIAREAMEKLAELRTKGYPEILPTNLDEIYDQNRIPLYIRFTKAAQQVPGFRYYETIYRGDDKKWALVSPYVDVVCYSPSIDDWLARGHAPRELEKEMRESNKEAWLYYNRATGDLRPKEIRIINGLFMWYTPIKANIPFVYAYPGQTEEGAGAQPYSYVFAETGDETGIVPTACYEAYREGIDDMKYLYTLESAVKAAAGQAAAAGLAGEAGKWLDGIRGSIPKEGKDRRGVWGPYRSLVQDISDRFSSEDLNSIRRQAARYIAELQHSR